MHILSFLLMASFVPAPLNSRIEKIQAARRADPEHWQTTAIDPIPILMPNETSQPVRRSRQQVIETIVQDTFRKFPELKEHEADLRKRLEQQLPK